jgi:ABC-2 type transport system permease protein
VFGFAVGIVVLGLDLSASTIPALALVLVVTVASCTAFGLMLGSFGLRARDVFFFSNLVYFLMLLFCGVNVPLDELPRWMQDVGNALPMTHGIEAARSVAGGRSLSDVGDLVLSEAAVGVFWGAAAFLLFRVFEIEGRRRASLETF